MFTESVVAPSASPVSGPAPATSRASRPDAGPRDRSDRALRRAIAGENLVLHYQPQWSLTDGSVIGAEALVRWPDRRRGLLLPGEFIPAAERSGAIHALGRWALRTACTEAAGWPVSVAVNVSPRQLRDGTLLADLGDALAASGLSPDALELELAEAALLGNDDDVLLTLCALRDAGVRLALDGFGRETASLSVLRRLPLTTLKIDRALVRELPNGHEDVSLMHAIIGAAHAMGLTVVAEGVETEEQRALLACLGCDAGQGFLHSRPMPPSALAGLLLHAHP